MRLIVIGDGPERSKLQIKHSQDFSIEWRGTLSRKAVRKAMARSRFLVLPSLCYENSPMTVLEALSVGTPVILPDHGSLSALISNSRDGFLFLPGDADSLAALLQTILAVPESTWMQLSQAARETYRLKYCAPRHYQKPLFIYEKAIENCQKSNRSCRIS